ncbi:hypothetical protein ASPWEDRAFT_37446 [Aspergillus wentii DTO 134E9]|uniref:Uncharacterized protein n=1 Tax=Aspergillus wentii DTO 134E9 TaxID=1073089 RepID=A0A1L9RXI3_ASPWE|nr:uncharacterized protein ASPWEDRAFT_37446 [Aspergillus wentii DTO 134E9]KAI9931694.1 hypothetical protein MW887_010271 [Aspergillus wentii]OJJ39632.1 hypothetical protein ASPWEDRAFT_37446 [Aspergillus wentii DTO 134E9]
MIPSAVSTALPTDAVNALPTGDINSAAEQQTEDVTAATAHLTHSVVPGEFPEGDKDSPDQDIPSFSFTDWTKGLVVRCMDSFESGVAGLVGRILPPPRRVQVYEAAVSRPIATTFITCQLVCCGVPLLVFVAGALVFAAVAILLWALLSFLILGPILLVSSLMGISLWGWGWVLYGLVKWVDELFLGGLITRFWLSRVRAQGEEGEKQEEAYKE